MLAEETPLFLALEKSLQEVPNLTKLQDNQVLARQDNQVETQTNNILKIK
jgi:hypothetical protein